MKKVRKYTIENLSEKQIRMIANSLEMYSRMICGQLSESYLPAIEYALMKEHYYKYKEHYPEKANNAMSNFCEKRDKVDEYLLKIKKIIWNLDKNESKGIHYDPESDLGYEMYKEILYNFEIENKENNGDNYRYNVHSSEPLHFTDEERIVIKSIDITREEKLKRILKKK